MKRRNLLVTAAATVSAVWLSSYLTRRARVMTTSNPEKFEVNKTEEEWRQTLTPEQFRVLRKHGTERAGTSPLDKNYAKGTYVCAGCGQPLFTAETKFNSGTGWPSFYAPIEGAIATSVDKSFFMTRVEVHCSRCGGHLGHVFNDGPAPTGKRYCMNGVAMEFTSQA
ncbi:peptide-methionine (R)-S-oxide reductase MsrB [Chlorogloeopsis sp. ULAP01]|uniref:peptide-methionine (R)-S-oxide reductase MsrB n=1 Tax=Chlorogloeopsis sp. ULAP01 TaxID=3056483 RepID=UPI0025AA5FE9|nr:peptide-methionine (R)-S-oxide reductase MsrB [Chlorogloeopsis sp. ULAP01]MDM9382655.1 peptide-methionine (R)-S-oxide reductase MsrB [Chlorogloeopsis sp. ULAP01]